MPKRASGITVDTNPSTQKNNGAKGADTPETQAMRRNHDVNSPRGGGTMAFPADDDSGTKPTPNFMTQVQRPDPQSTDEEITTSQRQVTDRGGGLSTCCGWLCCYRQVADPKDSPQKTTGSQQGAEMAETATRQAPPQITKISTDPPGPAGGTNREDSESSSEIEEGLLGKKDKKYKNKKCLVLDLDETLVHSSFKPVPDADFIVPVEIDSVVYKVYVLKRPFVDEFMREVAKYYEVVIFTASLSLYANPLLDMLDQDKVIEHRLFRESCVLHGQAYVKDMSKLGRKMKDIMIVDNSPLSYAFQPTSAIPITSWFDDRKDTQLRDLLPVLRTTLNDCDDVRDILDANNKSFQWLCAQGQE